jgi:hypothetical protein
MLAAPSFAYKYKAFVKMDAELIFKVKKVYCTGYKLAVKDPTLV